MAVWQLPQARDGFVDGVVDLEVLTLQIEAALPAVVEPDEGDAGVVGRAFADQEGIARQAAGLVQQGRGGRPVGLVQHGVVQRRHDARERGLLAHTHPNTLVIRWPSSRTSRLAAWIASGRFRHSNPFLKSEKLRPLAGHGVGPFPPVDIAQVELDRLNRPVDQPTRIVVAEHG